MRHFRPLILIAGLILTASTALAQSPAPPADAQGRIHEHTQGDHDHEDWQTRREKMVERKFPELHAKLDIQPNQEAAWTTFIADLKAARPPRPPRPQGAPADWRKPTSTPEALDLMLAHQDAMHSSLVKIDAAVKTFYAVLSKDQKTIFDDNFHHMRGPGGWERGPGRPGRFGGPPKD